MLMNLIKGRQSVRRYTDQMVDSEAIDRCLEAARLAPSACNAQPWKFIVVDDRELSNEVAMACKNTLSGLNKFAVQAPVMIVVVIEKANFTSRLGTQLKRKEYPLIDVGIASQHFCLQAHELGLGTCMIGWFDEKRIKKVLRIPGKREVGLVISLGYPDPEQKQREKIRKSKEEFSSKNAY